MEHTADYMVEVIGTSIEKLLINTAYSIAELAYNPATVAQKECRQLEVVEENFEEAYKEWIRKLIITICSQHFLYKRVSVNFSSKSNRIRANLYGELLNKSKHQVKKEIKALTEHQFKIEKTFKTRKATFVLDV
jgi:SHS2 domain-containing protein